MDGKRPLMLGFVGDSASGKTTIVRGVVRLLGSTGVTPLCLDDYHRYPRADLATLGLTHADPAANNLELMAEHLATLRAGGSVRKPVYDQRTGTLRGPETVAATDLITAYGMLTLTPPSLGALFDLTVFLEPDQAMRQAWRLERDVRERGYAPAQVLALREARERDAARFVAVQRPYADMVVRFHGSPGGDPANLALELLLRHGDRPNPLTPALDDLAAAHPPGFTLTRAIVDEDARPADRLVVDPGISPAAAATAAAAITAGLDGLSPIPLEELGQIRSAGQVSYSRALALIQLLVVRRLIAARQAPDGAAQSG